MRDKTSAFDTESIRLADWANALAHPARLALLNKLAKENRCICGELVEALPLSQSTVSQHLKVLKEAGLIQGEIEGPRTCYCIDPATIHLLREAMLALLEQLGRLGTSTQCCDATCLPPESVDAKAKTPKPRLKRRGAQ